MDLAKHPIEDPEERENREREQREREKKEEDDRKNFLRQKRRREAQEWCEKEEYKEREWQQMQERLAQLRREALELEVQKQEQENQRLKMEIWLKAEELRNQEAHAKFMAERQKSGNAFMTAELQKICANNVRRYTDTRGLEWYSVHDFMRKVYTGKTEKAVYCMWDKIKSNKDIVNFIRKENTTPVMSLWGLQMILILLDYERVHPEFHNVVRTACLLFIPNPMSAA